MRVYMVFGVSVVVMLGVSVNMLAGMDIIVVFVAESGLGFSVEVAYAVEVLFDLRAEAIIDGVPGIRAEVNANGL